MNFGSKFVYDYTDSEEEIVSDDEFQEGISRALDSDEDQAVEESGAAASASTPTSLDTNIPVPQSSSTVPPQISIQNDSDASGSSNRPKSGLLGKLFGRTAGRSAAWRRSQTESPESDSKSHENKYHSDPTVPKKKKHHWQLFKGRAASERPMLPPPSISEGRGRKWRRADTNVINVKFDQLTAPQNMHTGDPVYCANCKAVFSHLSVLDKNDDNQTWKCEFCDEVNEVDLEPEEIPASTDVTFMLQPALSTTSSGRKGTDESVVVFCIDTSGSMCVTTEVPGQVRMRGDRLPSIQSLNDTGESQFMPGQRRNVTYVSRLQSVQAAVDHQLGEMAKDHPNRRVALISFSSEVTVIGDGSKDPVHLSGDKLGNRSELVKVGSELDLPQPISSSRKVLGDKVFDLEEGGQTALGPSLLVAVSLACQVPGSKVIMCTDGLANVGLGNLDVLPDSEAYGEAANFFDEVSSMASEKGVSISVISIKGTDCKMIELGKMSNETGGQVNIVDPLKLTEEFGSILADPIIATNVIASLQVHRMLYIRNEDSKESTTVRHVGNVTKATEITFEYGKRRKQKKAKLEDPKPEEPVYDNAKEPTKVSIDESDGACPMDTSEQAEGVADNAVEQKAADVESSKPEPENKELPFQLQITYTDLEGARAMRLITQKMPVTRDREQAEKEMNPAAIGAHAAQRSARYALDGEYTTSRLNAMMYQRLFHRNTDREDVVQVYDNYLDNVGTRLENRLNRMQTRERATTGMTYSDEEDEGEDHAAVHSRSADMFMSRPTKKKSVNRWHTYQDEEASDIYCNAQMSSDVMQRKPKKK